MQWNSVHVGDTYFSATSTSGESVFSMNRLRGNLGESREEREAGEDSEGIPASQRLVGFFFFFFHVKVPALFVGLHCGGNQRRKYEFSQSY